MQKTLRRSGMATLLRALAESGSPVDISVADTEHEHADVEIRQVGGVHDSMCFEQPSGLTWCILDLAITNQTSRTIYCVDYELRFPWEDFSFNWLPDPQEAGKIGCYRFPGRGGFEFPRASVINHVLLEDGRLTPKFPVQGLLLATSGPMPEGLLHGQWVEATLALTASDRAEYPSTVRLWIDRSGAKQKHAGRRHDLDVEKAARDLGSMVADRDEPGAVRDSETVKPIPVSTRWTV